MASNLKGSVWNIWDLHVHTPASICQSYGGETPEVWEAFISDLEKLPAEFKVIGINDYLFLEGYKKVLEYKKAGRLENIDLILPVIEFRANSFVGNEKFKKINLHFIFADHTLLTPETIEQQFLSQVWRECHLDPSLTSATFQGVVTIDSLEQLGKEIRQATPVEKQSVLESSDRKLGFDNCSIDSDALFEALKKNTFLSGKYLAAIGKAEWEDFKWEGAGIADKKSFINRAHFVFAASPTLEVFLRGKQSLKSAGVNDRLLHCSDAHFFSSASESNRIGHCFNWIKADTTFEGLKQVLYEPEERLRAQESNPFTNNTKVCVEKIRIRPASGYPIHADCELSLNRNLVALIGGRGTGKSALLETVAFMNEDHVKEDQNGVQKLVEYARTADIDAEIDVELVDKDGRMELHTKSLSERGSLELPFLYIGQERITAIATDDQRLTETVCSAIGINVETFDLTPELHELEDLINDVDSHYQSLHRLIEKYLDDPAKIRDYDGFETFLDEKIRLTKDWQKKLSSDETVQTLNEINSNSAKMAVAMEAIDRIQRLSGSLEMLSENQEIDVINKVLGQVFSQPTSMPKVNTDLHREIGSSLVQMLTDFIEEHKKSSELLSISLQNQGLKEDVNALIKSGAVAQEKVNLLTKDLTSFKSLLSRIVVLKTQRLLAFQKVISKMGVQKKYICDKYQEFVASRDGGTAEEKEFFQKIIDGLEVVGEVSFDKQLFLERASEFLHGRKFKNLSEVEAIFVAAGGVLTFENFVEWVLNCMDRWVDSNSDVFISEGAVGFIKSLMLSALAEASRINTRVALHGKSISRMSAGQKGTTLLKIWFASSTAQIFIIDQPEDHLDNDFLMTELVPLIRKFKYGRQIIMATHSANLVINSDAEQIIIANLDGSYGTDCYLSGSIENPEINIAIQNILEGGKEAFKKREKKYQFN